MNPNVFEIDPLDLGISRIQFNLSKRIRGVEADVFEVISEKYESRDSTMPLFSIEVNCFPKTERGGVVLQFIFKTVSGERLERFTVPKSKDEIVQVVENRKFLLFCKQMVVQLLGDEVLDEDIRKEIVNDSTGMEVSTKSGLSAFCSVGNQKKSTLKVNDGLQVFKNDLKQALISVRTVEKKCYHLIISLVDWAKRLFQSNCAKSDHTIIKIAHNKTIKVFGVTFHGIEEVIEYARKGIPKEGVYVGKDFERYPCFDSSDYAYENRYYWNFVFAQSEEELKKKVNTLILRKPEANYKKLTDELAPMVYWEGDPYYPMEIVNE